MVLGERGVEPVIERVKPGFRPQWYLYRQQHNAHWMPICVSNPPEVSSLKRTYAELLGPFDSYEDAIAQMK